jgi:hypothetical protein
MRSLVKFLAGFTAGKQQVKGNAKFSSTTNTSDHTDGAKWFVCALNINLAKLYVGKFFFFLIENHLWFKSIIFSFSVNFHMASDQ